MMAPTCRRCGAELQSAYRTRLVAAQEQHQVVDQAGVGMVSVLAATSACSWNCLAVLAALEAGPLADAAVQVVAERERQMTAEGYTPEADTELDDGVLARAGIAYAWDHSSHPNGLEWGLRHGPLGKVSGHPPDCWPWLDEQWNPKDRLRDLVRAGALLAAEADRDVRTARARAADPPF